MNVGGHYTADNQDGGRQQIALRNPAGLSPGM
jgi:hypothetical protein